MLQVVPPLSPLKPLPGVDDGNLFDLYFEYMAGKEPPNIFNRWCLIAGLSAYLGRSYWLPFGEGRLYPNTYCMLIGDPGSRKSTAIKSVEKLLGAAGYTTFAADKTSKEKFLLDLEGSDDLAAPATGNDVLKNLFGDAGFVPTEPREVFIVADEFNEFAGSGNLEFLSLLGALWDWDKPDKPYEYRLKNSKSIAIYQPTVSILSGNTHSSFAKAFPPESVGQGFLSRLILIYGEESGRKETIPKAAPESVKSKLLQQLAAIRECAVGPAVIGKHALGMLDVIYRQPGTIGDMRFKHYATRRFTHLLKLCLICSATRLSTTITEADVLLANTILAYAEHFMPRALGEFGMARSNAVSNRILALLTETRKVVTLSELWKQVSSDLDRPEDLHRLVEGLTQANKIQYVQNKVENLAGYIIVRKMLGDQQLYVDWNLLKERKP